jgi:anti-repressor protein
MNDLIKINVNESQEPIVSGRELHEFLEVKDKYTQWFKRMTSYGFTKDIDYTLVSEKTETNNPKNPWTTIINHALKLDMAKELSMIQRTDRGKQALRLLTMNSVLRRVK